MRLWGAAVTLVLIAGACGSGRTSAASQHSTTTASAASGSFGTLGEVCGKGSAKGVTDQGVTDAAIDIGYGDDAGYAASPGLDHEMGDGVKAFVKWCNEAGGINGRQINATYYDAKITEVNNVWTEACKKEFFVVGQGFALDASQETVRRACKLPSVAGFSVSPPFTNAPLKYEPNPQPADFVVMSGFAQLAKLFPDKIAKTATLYANYSATIDTRDKVESPSAAPALGYSFICDQQFNIVGEADWKPFVQKLKDCGAQIVYAVAAPYPNLENLLEAAAQLDYRPIWYGDPQLYDAGFARWNTSGFGDNVYFRESYTPLFEAKVEPAAQQYVEIVKKASGDVDQLGEQSASAFLLWAVAAKSCGSNLTRQCVLDYLAKQHAWTGGGMHAPADAGGNKPTQCGLLMKLSGTTFTRVTPKAEGKYECQPTFVAPVTGPALERAKLDANRIAQL